MTLDGIFFCVLAVESLFMQWVSAKHVTFCSGSLSIVDMFANNTIRRIPLQQHDGPRFLLRLFEPLPLGPTFPCACLGAWTREITNCQADDPRRSRKGEFKRLDGLNTRLEEPPTF